MIFQILKEIKDLKLGNHSLLANVARVACHFRHVLTFSLCSSLFRAKVIVARLIVNNDVEPSLFSAPRLEKMVITAVQGLRFDSFDLDFSQTLQTNNKKNDSKKSAVSARL